MNQDQRDGLFGGVIVSLIVWIWGMTSMDPWFFIPGFAGIVIFLSRVKP